MGNRSHILRSFEDPEKHFRLALEDPWFSGLTRINAELINATSVFYAERGIIPVLMPVTVNSVSSPMGLGSDSLPVRADIMGETTYLADSMQFQLEFLLRHGLRGTYYVMPTFRGEDHDATHLNQFFHSEAEIPGGLDEVMELVESYVKRLCATLLTGPASEALTQLAPDGTGHVADLAGRDSFPRITFAEAVKLLEPEHVVRAGTELACVNRAGERRLIEHFGGIVWLTDLPKMTVPFYQADRPDGTARCADLLFGTGEVVGCGERHVTMQDTVRALNEHQVAVSDYDWYVRMKELAPMRTAGFGLGLERFLMWALDHEDIRDLHVMPRLRGVPTWV
ncbi:asparagine synthetase A [Streptomyces sp. NPDC051840]|uniref:asparagine synthetase A n=1 Tax=unclassified Streptomyces TaxID=2593676 RepID=UPI0034190B99